MSPAEKAKLMFKCPEHRCTHKTLQKSNLITHYNAKHSGVRPYICNECNYCAADPSCLYRHTLALHPSASQQPRVRKADSVTAQFPFTLERAGSPVPSLDSLPGLASWLAFSPAPSSSSDTDSLPSLSSSPSPSAPEDLPAPFYPAPSAPEAYWAPTLEEACRVLGTSIEPSPAPGPALQYPAQSLEVFAFEPEAGFFSEADTSLFSAADDLLFFTPAVAEPAYFADEAYPVYNSSFYPSYPSSSLSEAPYAPFMGEFTELLSY